MPPAEGDDGRGAARRPDANGRLPKASAARCAGALLLQRWLPRRRRCTDADSHGQSAEARRPARGHGGDEEGHGAAEALGRLVDPAGDLRPALAGVIILIVLTTILVVVILLIMMIIVIIIMMIMTCRPGRQVAAGTGRGPSGRRCPASAPGFPPQRNAAGGELRRMTCSA